MWRRAGGAGGRKQETEFLNYGYKSVLVTERDRIIIIQKSPKRPRKKITYNFFQKLGRNSTVLI